MIYLREGLFGNQFSYSTDPINSVPPDPLNESDKSENTSHDHIGVDSSSNSEYNCLAANNQQVVLNTNISFNNQNASEDNYDSLSEHSNVYSTLNKLRCNNLNRIILSHLNINSVRNKFVLLKDMITGKMDILLLSETKIDDSFPSTQFNMPGFSTPYRFDRSAKGGDFIIY